MMDFYGNSQHHMAYEQQMPSTSAAYTNKMIQPSGVMVHQNVPYRPQTPQTPSQQRISVPGSPYARSMPSSPYRQSPGAASEPMQQLRQGYARQAQTMQWMNDQYFNNNIIQQQAYPVNQAYSVMSGKSGISHMSHNSALSGTSVMSALSINTQITEAANFHNYYAQNYAYPSAPSSASSATENIDPKMMLQINGAVDTCIAFFEDVNPESPRKVIKTILNFAKEKYFDLADANKIIRLLKAMLKTIEGGRQPPEVVKQLLQGIFYMTQSKRLVECMYQMSRRSPWLEIVYSQLTEDATVTPSALIVVLSLCGQPDQHGVYFRRMVRSVDMVNRLSLLFESATLPNNVRGLTMDCLRHAIGRDSLKECFVKNKRGMDRVLHIMHTEVDEKVLFAASRILHTMINSNKTKMFAEEFVARAGIQTVSALLAHASPRLLYELLNCLRCASDVALIAKQDITESISSVLRLLGSHDVKIIRLATGFLPNVMGVDSKNKRIVCDVQGADIILSVLGNLSYLTAEHINQKDIVNEIQENSMMCLRNLSIGDQEVVFKVCLQIAQKSGSAQLLQLILASSGYQNKLRILHVLTKTLYLVPNYLHMFLEPLDASLPPLSTALLDLIWNAFRLHGQASEDKVKTLYYDLIEKSLGLLLKMLQNPMFTDMILARLRQMNPVMLLVMTRDETLCHMMLTFLDQVSAVPSATDASGVNIVSIWAENRECAQLLQSWCQHAVMEFARMANNICARLPNEDRHAAFGMDSMDFDDSPMNEQAYISL